MKDDGFYNDDETFGEIFQSIGLPKENDRERFRTA
jgi:hypothetical protein